MRKTIDLREDIKKSQGLALFRSQSTSIEELMRRLIKIMQYYCSCIQIIIKKLRIVRSSLLQSFYSLD